MSVITKFRLMARTGLESPAEFCDRAASILDRLRDRWRPAGADCATTQLDDALRLTCNGLLLPVPDATRERGLEDIERIVSEKAEILRRESPLPPYENADLSFARFCYLACRAIAPAVVVETGVASGVTSAFILQALSLNGRGTLWSVDLPPLAADASRYVGAVVPNELRNRWQLRPGTSRRILPGLLAQLEHVDIFIHDSLHTYRNMWNEFRLAWPHLAPGGLLMADDVETNRSWCEWASATESSHWWVVRQDKKKAYFGVLIKPAPGLEHATASLKAQGDSATL